MMAETIMIIKVIGTYVLGLAGLALVCGIATTAIFRWKIKKERQRA